MNWVELAPLVFLSTLIFLVPGAGLAAALGIRGSMLAVVAPPLSMCLIGGSAIVLELLDITWNLATFAALAVCVIALALAAWHLIRHLTHVELIARIDLRKSSLLIGLGISLVTAVSLLVMIFPDPKLFAQTFDNIFHSNVIQYILDSGHASSLTVAQVTSAGRPGITYPAAWHDFVALLLGTARVVAPGVTVAAAVNAATITVIVGGWALGLLALTQVVAGSSLPASVIAVALTTTMPLFPWFFLEWGSLYPNLLANSLVPGLLATLLLLRETGTAEPPTQIRSRRALIHQGRWQFRLPYFSGRDQQTGARRVQTEHSSAPGHHAHPIASVEGRHAGSVLVMVLVASVAGLALAHPNAAFAVGVAAIAVGWSTYLKLLRRSHGRPLLAYAGSGATLLGMTISLCYAWVKLAPDNPVKPPPPLGMRDAFWGLLSAAPADTPATFALPVMIVGGVVACLWRRRFLYLLMWLLPTTLYVVAFSTASPSTANGLAGLFFQDPRRVAGFVLVLSLPLVLSAVGALADFLIWCAGLTRLHVVRGVALTLLTIALALGIAVPSIALSLAPRVATFRALLYDQTEESRYVSADERALMDRMRDELPADARVIGDPGNGSPFIYSVARVPVVFAHVFTDDSPAMLQVRKHLFDETQLDSTCQALRDLHAYYFADFGKGSQYFAGFKYYPGLATVKYRFLSLVDSQGDARLYRITACD